MRRLDGKCKYTRDCCRSRVVRRADRGRTSWGTPTPEAHSLIGTAEEVAEGLAALEEVGVAYVLLFGQGSRDNLLRFAERVMPKFGAPGAP